MIPSPDDAPEDVVTTTPTPATAPALTAPITVPATIAPATTVAPVTVPASTAAPTTVTPTTTAQTTIAPTTTAAPPTDDEAAAVAVSLWANQYEDEVSDWVNWWPGLVGDVSELANDGDVLGITNRCQTELDDLIDVEGPYASMLLLALPAVPDPELMSHLDDATSAQANFIDECISLDLETAAESAGRANDAVDRATQRLGELLEITGS